MARRRQRTHDIYLPNKKEQADEDRRARAAKRTAERPPPSPAAEKPAEKKPKRGLLQRLRDPFGMSSTLKRAGDTAKRGAPARRRGRGR